MSQTVKMKCISVGEDNIPRESFLVEESHFATEVRLELEKARSVGPNGYAYPPMNSLHEGYAVILEEVEEFWDMVKLKPSKRDPNALYKELVQIAAMAQRTAEDVVQEGISFFINEGAANAEDETVGDNTANPLCQGTQDAY